MVNLQQKQKSNGSKANRKKKRNRKKHMQAAHSKGSEDSDAANADEQDGDKEVNHIRLKGNDDKDSKDENSADDETENLNQEESRVGEIEDCNQQLKNPEEGKIPSSVVNCDSEEDVLKSKCIDDSEEEKIAGKVDVDKPFPLACNLNEQDQVGANLNVTPEIPQQRNGLDLPSCEELQLSANNADSLQSDNNPDQSTEKLSSAQLTDLCTDIIDSIVKNVTKNDDQSKHGTDIFSNEIEGSILSNSNESTELRQCARQAKKLFPAAANKNTASSNYEGNQKVIASNNDDVRDQVHKGISTADSQGGTSSSDIILEVDPNIDCSDERGMEDSDSNTMNVSSGALSTSTDGLINPQVGTNRKSWDKNRSRTRCKSEGSDKNAKVSLPPVVPRDTKMAEKIAVAISKEDKKFNDLMVSLSGSKSGDEGSPLVAERRDLVRGAFNTLSNSTHACISPKAELQEETGKSDAPLPEIDLSRLPRRLETELTAAVEVQLFPRLDLHIGKSPLQKSADELLKWIETEMAAGTHDYQLDGSCDSSAGRCSDSLSLLKELLNRPEIIDRICQHAVDGVIRVQAEERVNINSADDYSSASNDCDDIATDIGVSAMESAALTLLRRSDRLHAFQVSSVSASPTDQSLLPANFTAFLQKISHLTGIECPIQGSPLLDHFAALSLRMGNEKSPESSLANSLREQIFGHDDQEFLNILRFLKKSSDPNADDTSNITPTKDSDVRHEIIFEQTSSREINEGEYNSIDDEACVTPTPQVSDKKMMECLTTKRTNKTSMAPTLLESLKIPCPDFSRYSYYKVPRINPCPFETSVWNVPSIVLIVLGCLGDPVAVCRMKMVNKFCNRIVSENEYIMMKDSVRLGGMPNHVRPAFWMWITLEKCQSLQKETSAVSQTISVADPTTKSVLDDLSDFQTLEQEGRASKWHPIIERDVTRAFGNLPPHKSKGSRRNSIVRALMSWGQNHLLRRHQDGSCRVVSSSGPSGKGEPIRRITILPPVHAQRGGEAEKSNNDVDLEIAETVSDWGGISPTLSNISSAGSLARTNSIDVVLSGNELTQDMKADLQKKLETILDVIAAVHEGLGYCQGK